MSISSDSTEPESQYFDALATTVFEVKAKTKPRRSKPRSRPYCSLSVLKDNDNRRGLLFVIDFMHSSKLHVDRY